MLNNNRKAFSLMELMIVIMIIATLVGVVMPFVANYIDDGRISKAQQDLQEIRNALVRYENDQVKLYEFDTIRALVGPYLMRAIVDPWGTPYVISPERSICYSLGPDKTDNTGTEIIEDFRPPLSISRAFWEDNANNGVVSDGDKLVLRFTRPVNTPPASFTVDDFTFTYGGPATFTNVEILDASMTARITIGFLGSPSFMPGRDYLTATENSKIRDFNGTPCRSYEPTVLIKPQ